MSYFRLNNDSFLVEGVHDSAVYDVHGRRVLLLDGEASRLLRDCEENLELDGRLSRRELVLLELLEEAGIGAFHDEPGYVDKFLLHQPLEWMGLGQLPPDYRQADWSMTNHCDLACTFCGHGEETLVWQACQTCLRHQGTEGAAWLPEDLPGFVAQIAALEVRLLHLRGGDPFLAWDALERIASAAHDHGLALAISTPGTAAQADDILDFCRQWAVQPNIILFGGAEEESYAVCGRGGVLNRQQALIDALLEARHPFSTTFLLTDAQRHQRQKLQDLARDEWGIETAFAEVCRRDEMVPGFRLSHVGDRARPLSPWRSADEFFFRISHHGCMHGRFEIGADGRLRTCAGLGIVHGDVTRDGLRRALAQDGLYEMWGLSKTKITPCSGCALRLTCIDCSAFELPGMENEIVRQAYCPYDGGLTDLASRWGNEPFVHVLRLQA